MSITPEEAVDAAATVFGRHSGYRALHAKGTLCKGTFTASADGAALTRAAHMQTGVTVPATFRFSNGAGNPHHPDFRPDPRGMAVKMYLPDGSRTDIVAVTTPVFPSRNPDGFIELLRAQTAGAKAPLKMAQFFRHHPEALRAIAAAAPTLRPPGSYAAVPYHGIHAFKWIDDQGGERYVRYRLAPLQDAPKPTPWRARQLGPDYLQDELRKRLARGPVRFSLEVQIAMPGDPVDDPSAAWPKARRRVQAGTFEVTGLETERETGGDVLVFDPTRVTDGIELSDDPVLRFRSAAYGVSVARRMP